MISFTRCIPVVAAAIALSSAAAQTPAADPTARLRAVLPADVADRVIATIDSARAQQLPAAALENRALKFASRGVPPAAIQESVSTQLGRMLQARSAITEGRGAPADSDEIDAGAEVIRRGVDGAQVSALAKSAPSGRSLAVPLFVIGSLIDRGLPADSALFRVQQRLQARASDNELQQLPGSQAAAHRPATTGQDMAATKRPASAGPPANVPRNAGNGGRPTSPGAGHSRRP